MKHSTAAEGIGCYIDFFFLTLTENKHSIERCAEDHRENSLASSTPDELHNQECPDGEKTNGDGRLNGNHASSSDDADMAKGRPMSPTTLALMCDEQDTMFMAASSSNNRLIGQDNCVSSSQLTEVYAEQERIVLAKFRDCLNRLITCGEIKGNALALSGLNGYYLSFIFCIN